MTENSEEHHQSNIYQSFSNLNNDNSINNKVSSSKNENVEFTFKKIVSESIKSKHTEKGNDLNIYSKNDENIKQSGHFFNEDKNESKYKILLNNIKEKNNIIKPLFKFITQKKKTVKNMKNIKNINKKIIMKNLDNFNKTKINSLCYNHLKKRLKINNNNLEDINQPNNTSSNITTINNNNKYIFNFLSKGSIKTFLEISHDSFDNEMNENKINTNDNKENYNSQNINIIKYKKNINLNRKIFNDIMSNRNEDNKNKKKCMTKDKAKNDKNDKYEKNISFEILKNEYKELKQKIFENKIKNKNYKLNKQCPQKLMNIQDKKNASNKKLIVSKKKIKFNSTNLSSVTYIKKDKKQKNINNIIINKFSLININMNNKNDNNINFNSHRRLNSLSSNYHI